MCSTHKGASFAALRISDKRVGSDDVVTPKFVVLFDSIRFVLRLSIIYVSLAQLWVRPASWSFSFAAGAVRMMWHNVQTFELCPRS